MKNKPLVNHSHGCAFHDESSPVESWYSRSSKPNTKQSWNEWSGCEAEPGLSKGLRNPTLKNSVSHWMVGGLEHFFLYIGKNNPKWLIFFRGVGQPPTSIWYVPNTWDNVSDVFIFPLGCFQTTMENDVGICATKGLGNWSCLDTLWPMVMFFKLWIYDGGSPPKGLASFIKFHTKIPILPVYGCHFQIHPPFCRFWLVLTTSEVRAQHHAVLAQSLQVFGENGVGSLLWAALGHCGLVVDNHGTYPNTLEYPMVYSTMVVPPPSKN